MNVNDDLDPLETGEWMDALRSVQQHRGIERTNYLVNSLVDAARREGAYIPLSLTTAYKNTIAPEHEETSSGIRCARLWGAMRMHRVLRLEEQD